MPQRLPRSQHAQQRATDFESLASDQVAFGGEVEAVDDVDGPRTSRSAGKAVPQRLPRSQHAQQRATDLESLAHSQHMAMDASAVEPEPSIADAPSAPTAPSLKHSIRTSPSLVDSPLTLTAVASGGTASSGSPPPFVKSPLVRRVSGREINQRC